LLLIVALLSIKEGQGDYGSVRPDDIAPPCPRGRYCNGIPTGDFRIHYLLNSASTQCPFKVTVYAHIERCDLLTDWPLENYACFHRETGRLRAILCPTTLFCNWYKRVLGRQSCIYQQHACPEGRASL